eukprot:434732_1
MPSTNQWTIALVAVVLTVIVVWWKSKDKKEKHITSKQKQAIQQTFTRNPNQIIASHQRSSLNVKVKDLYTLNDGQWLNDEIINFYLALLIDKNLNQLSISHRTLRVLFMNSFFYTKLTQNGYNYKNVKRWTRVEKFRKKGIIGINNIFEMDKIIFPINISNVHWCCGCINIKDKQFEYYDSMHGSPYKFFLIMQKYIQDEYYDKIVQNNSSNYILD